MESAMSEIEIETILREFDPIHRAIAQPAGKDAVLVSGVRACADSGADADPSSDAFATAYFCFCSEQMLAMEHGFPDSHRYGWITNPRSFGNSFEAACQGNVVGLLIGLWEHRGYRCDKLVIVRNEHTGGYHIETYETANAYFACISYQFSNLFNRYALLNHYLIGIGKRAGQVPCVTPTNEVGGQLIERAIRGNWKEACPHLDAFLTTVMAASAYEASEVLLNEHVSVAAEQFYTNNQYTHLRDASKLMSGPFYLPAEAMWTMYADQGQLFTLAHEVTHIYNGDIRIPGRDMVEEMGADLGAIDLIAYLNATVARRSGMPPSIANIVMGPVLFFSLSRVFAYFDDFERKYRGRQLSEAAMTEAMKEELALQQRSICAAALMVGGGWLTDPGAAPFWDIAGELGLVDMALRRRLWELAGVTTSVSVELEIGLLQDLIQGSKGRTERDVMAYRQQHRSET
jgi:hypothetical protein